MQALPCRTTPRAATCCPGWMSSQCGSGLRTPSVLPQPRGSPMVAKPRWGRGWGLECERQVARFWVCTSATPFSSELFALASSCSSQYCPHTSRKPQRKKCPPLSDLTIYTSDSTPSARTSAGDFVKESAASDLGSRKYYPRVSGRVVLHYHVPFTLQWMDARRPTEIHKDSSYFFCVAREFVLLAIGLRYPLAMEHPVHGLNPPSISTPSDLAVSQQKFVSMAVRAVEDIDVHSSLMRVSTTEGLSQGVPGNQSEQAARGSRWARKPTWKSGCGRHQGESIYHIFEYPDPSLQNLRLPSAKMSLISSIISHETFSSLVCSH